MSAEQISPAHPSATGGHAVEQAHPGPVTYVKVGVVLFLITVVEVAILYMGGFGWLVVPIFLLLSAGKFATVAGFYMHLKFDSPLLTAFFGAGLLVAAIIIIALIALINYNPPISAVTASGAR